MGTKIAVLEKVEEGISHVETLSVQLEEIRARLHKHLSEVRVSTAPLPAKVNSVLVNEANNAFLEWREILELSLKPIILDLAKITTSELSADRIDESDYDNLTLSEVKSKLNKEIESANLYSGMISETLQKCYKLQSALISARSITSS